MISHQNTAHLALSENSVIHQFSSVLPHPLSHLTQGIVIHCHCTLRGLEHIFDEACCPSSLWLFLLSCLTEHNCSEDAALHIADVGDVSFLLSLLTILNMEVLRSLSCSLQALMSCYQCLCLITYQQSITMSFLSSCNYSHTPSSLLYPSKDVFLSKIFILQVDTEDFQNIW